MNTFVIARLTFREASRRWVAWAALLLGFIFLIVYAVGFNEIQRGIKGDVSSTPSLMGEMHNFMLMAGLYVVNFLTVMMAVLTSVDTLSGEIASGTIHSLVTKPMRRWEIVMGKWLGFAGMLTLYLLFMAGGVMGVVYLISGYYAPNPFQGLGLMWLNVVLLFSVSILGGSILSTLANGVLVFGLYSIAFIGGWIEQFGSLMNNQTAVNIGVICSLIIPSDALWRRAAYEMQSPIMSMFNRFSPFSSGSVPSPLMIIYAFLYTLVVIALAINQFNRRDL